MDLKQLKTFLRVAETGSLSKASDRLRLAQPALSRHIKLLEADIGLDLFVRHGRGMELTDAGQELFQRVGGLVSQLEKSIEDLQALPGDPKGRVSIGILPTVSMMLATPIIMRLSREFPNISLRIVEGLTGHLIDWLQRGELDLAFLPGPGADFHVRAIDLLYEEYVLLAPLDSDIGRDGTLAVADLASLDLIVSSHMHGMRKIMEAAAHKAGISLSVNVEVDTLPLALSLVEAGLGYAILPGLVVDHRSDRQRFRTIRLVKPAVTRQLILALPAGRADTRAVTAVRDVILKEIAALIRAGTWRATADSGISHL